MKAIKYLLIGALVIGSGVPAMAQDDNATIAQAEKIIKSKSNVEDQIKDIFKANKKNAVVLTGIARAYLDVKDTANAQKYVDMAIKRDKSYGKAYVLMGDIEALKDNGGAASAWYEQAVYFDPKNPEGYRRYAQVNSKVSPSSSVSMLEKLRQARPDYPVDIISAQIYDKAGNLTKALEYYEKVDKNKMEDADLVSFALDYFLKGDFEKSLAISQYGNNKFEKNPALNRISFFNLTNLKKYPEALEYADRLFNHSDSTKITSSDYLYYGYAYQGNKEYQKAIDMFNKVIGDSEAAESDKTDALKNVANAYSELGNIEKAASIYSEYMKGLKNVTALDYNTLANMYMTKAEKSKGAEQIAAYNKASEMFGEMAEKFPSVADFAEYQRAHIGFNVDPETKTGAAKPHYEKLIEIIKGHATKADRDDERLIEAYRYLGYFYTLKNNKATANTYWNKILEIDPNNATAKQALGK